MRLERWRGSLVLALAKFNLHACVILVSYCVCASFFLYQVWRAAALLGSSSRRPLLVGAAVVLQAVC